MHSNIIGIISPSLIKYFFLFIYQLLPQNLIIYSVLLLYFQNPSYLRKYVIIRTYELLNFFNNF